MRVIYLPLEPYRERYTELLTQWTRTRWEKIEGVELETVVGEKLEGGIGVGQVLDAHGRSYWSLTQMARLVKLLRDRPLNATDAIYFDDMFTPGFEALPYILDQVRTGVPHVIARNHAQSVDPDDFVHAMRGWMRPYETMVDEVATVVCASSVHAEFMAVANLRAPVVLGLPYDEDDVRRIAGSVLAWEDRPPQVIYSSRLDTEKQPHFFLDIVERLGSKFDFVLCTGSERLRSNDPSAIHRAERLAELGLLTILTGCSKHDYYQQLGRSRVQLNTARQDFVSYTAIEASTLGAVTLAPAFRSFPETLRSNPSQLFVPWSVDEACEKLQKLVTGAVPRDVGWLSRVQHGTLDRIMNLIRFNDAGNPWWELP